MLEYELWGLQWSRWCRDGVHVTSDLSPPLQCFPSLVGVKHNLPKSPWGRWSHWFLRCCHPLPPQWGAADAEIKVPSGENTELKRSPFKVWSRSVYSNTCFAYCQEFLPRLFLPFRSIHLHFFQNPSQFFPVLAVANTGSCVGPQNKIGHPVGCRFPCWVPAEYK